MAADVAYTKALLVEYCSLKKIPFSGGAASDIYKCFDQIQRPLRFKLLEEAGMPARVLEPYKKFLEAIHVHNTVDGGLGNAYHKPTSIPQRDPFSMMVVALILRPWIMQMREAAVMPRILADDLQIFASGPRRLENLEHAFNLTHEHLEDMGAKIAPAKPVTFTPEPVDRRWLRTHKWRRLGTTKPVILHVRDLGAHLNTAAAQMVGSTLTARMRETTRSVIRFGEMKAPYPPKTSVISTKMLPEGLYGCETAPVNESAMKTFRP